jgi:hypothetical protein
MENSDIIYNKIKRYIIEHIGQKYNEYTEGDKLCPKFSVSFCDDKFLSIPTEIIENIVENYVIDKSGQISSWCYSKPTYNDRIYDFCIKDKE